MNKKNLDIFQSNFDLAKKDSVKVFEVKFTLSNEETIEEIPLGKKNNKTDDDAA